MPSMCTVPGLSFARLGMAPALSLSSPLSLTAAIITGSSISTTDMEGLLLLLSIFSRLTSERVPSNNTLQPVCFSNTGINGSRKILWLPAPPTTISLPLPCACSQPGKATEDAASRSWVDPRRVRLGLAGVIERFLSGSGPHVVSGATLCRGVCTRKVHDTSVKVHDFDLSKNHAHACPWTLVPTPLSARSARAGVLKYCGVLALGWRNAWRCAPCPPCPIVRPPLQRTGGGGPRPGPPAPPAPPPLQRTGGRCPCRRTVAFNGHAAPPGENPDNPIRPMSCTMTNRHMN